MGLVLTELIPSVVNAELAASTLKYCKFVEYEALTTIPVTACPPVSTLKSIDTVSPTLTLVAEGTALSVALIILLVVYEMKHKHAHNMSSDLPPSVVEESTNFNHDVPIPDQASEANPASIPKLEDALTPQNSNPLVPQSTAATEASKTDADKKASDPDTLILPPL